MHYGSYIGTLPYHLKYILSIVGMAGKYTNLMYDRDAYDERTRRSTDGLQYHLDGNFAVNCNNCFAPHGPRGGNQARVSRDQGNIVDIDSVLKGIGRSNSKCSGSQMPQFIDDRSFYMPPTCPSTLETNYSRYTHPSYDIRGLAVPDMRFDYPLSDPQCQIFEPFTINTRLQAKDNHKAVWQTPMDQQNLLPSERAQDIKRCRITVECDNNTPNRRR